MQERKPAVLLVGEAPGYKGCRLSGIPFTSEYILTHVPFFTETKKGTFRVSPQPEVEKTAKVVWGELQRHDFYPLLWNAFPFHPHAAGDESTNRAPNQTELREGRAFIRDLQALFGIADKNVFAVGRKAQKSLGVSDRFYIRHPSHGGQSDFCAGLSGVVRSLV